ncbi:MAG: hypothetical protein ACP5O5_07735, partial [Fervidicoccaceae archaeon]
MRGIMEQELRFELVEIVQMVLFRIVLFHEVSLRFGKNSYNHIVHNGRTYIYAFLTLDIEIHDYFWDDHE